jgi:hypothetical protein
MTFVPRGLLLSNKVKTTATSRLQKLNAATNPHGLAILKSERLTAALSITKILVYRKNLYNNK